MSRPLSVTALALAGWALAGPAPAQTRSKAPPPPPPAAAPPAAPAPLPAKPEGAGDYQIGAEDILKVTVYGHDDLTQTVLVQSDGTVTFPLVGRVKASDLSTAELERKLAVLLARGYIRNPQVTVVVQEFRSKTVYVVGEVQRPGPYPLAGQTGLLEVLARAAITGSAGAEAVVVRPPKGASVSGPTLPAEAGGAGATTGPAAEVFRVNLREIQAGDLSRNIRLQPNDTVFVPQAAKVFVTGEVRTPGAYAWFPGMTARQLISLAGGLTPDGSDGRLRIVRPASSAEGKAEEDKIKLDEPVKAGETLVVRRRLF
jgi:polysaccharide export outer membrane protein